MSSAVIGLPLAISLSTACAQVGRGVREVGEPDFVVLRADGEHLAADLVDRAVAEQQAFRSDAVGCSACRSRPSRLAARPDASLHAN